MWYYKLTYDNRTETVGPFETRQKAQRDYGEASGALGWMKRANPDLPWEEVRHIEFFESTKWDPDCVV
jgi:hypothetical protein